MHDDFAEKVRSILGMLRDVDAGFREWDDVCVEYAAKTENTREMLCGMYSPSHPRSVRNHFLSKWCRASLGHYA